MKRRGPNQGKGSEQMAPNPNFSQFSVKDKEGTKEASPIKPAQPIDKKKTKE